MLNYAEITSSSLEGLNQEYLSITNNLANASTVGYKRRLSAFAQVLSGEQSSAQMAEFGKIETTAAVDFSQGGVNHTGRNLDLALAGDGFFVVETPQGELYTRNGTFRLNNDRQLVDSTGQMVAGLSGPIVMPASTSTLDIQVSRDGSISAGGTVIGKLKLVKFENPQKLEAYGGNYFRAVEGVVAELADGLTVEQGVQESSNVDIVKELVSLIMVTRVYEANIKSITTRDEQIENILNVAMS